MPVPQTRSNLVIMVDRLILANTSCDMIPMVMNPPTGVHLTARPEFEAYNQMYRDIATERHLTLIDHDTHGSKILKADPKQFFESVPRWDSSKRRGLHECHHAEHAPCFRNDLQTNRSKVVFSHSSFQTVIEVIQRRGLW